MITKRTLIVLIVGLLALGLLTSCGPGKLGTEKNPIVWVFVPSGETERVTAGAESVAEMLHDETGLYFDIRVATEYAGAIEAMCADPAEAHMASLATFAYVMAADRGCAEAAMLSVRYGSPTYNGQLFVRADSGITDLSQLGGKTFCRPDPLSTSGWVIPSVMLKGAGVDPDNGDCDVGATYVDARGTVEEDYPDVMEQTVVIALEPDIPNDGVQFQSSVEQELRTQIVDGLLAVAATEAGVEALDTAYSWQELIKAEDSYYDAFRQILQSAGIQAEDLMGN